MDLQEKHQIDLTRSITKVKERARPWRAIIALVLAVVSAVLAAVAHHLPLGSHQAPYDVIRYAATAAFCIFGVAATFGLADQARAGLQPTIGAAHAGVLRYALVLLGLFVILLVGFTLSGIGSVRQLLIGGAVTGVLLGIAAQQSLANLFAGMVLLFARPFRVGDQVWIRSGALGGMVEGMVGDISLTYVRLETETGRCLLPNSQVLAAVVGPDVPAREPQARDSPVRQDPAAQQQAARQDPAAQQQYPVRDDPARDGQSRAR